MPGDTPAADRPAHGAAKRPVASRGAGDTPSVRRRAMRICAAGIRCARLCPISEESLGAGICGARHPGFAKLAASGIGEVSWCQTARFSGGRHPGAGKTTFALRIAAELLADGTVEQVTIVVPTEHLKIQWASAAARIGIALDPKFSNSNSQTSSEYHGVVITYAQVASHPTRHRVRTENRRTLVIFDEIHHGGDAKSWVRRCARRSATPPAVCR